MKIEFHDRSVRNIILFSAGKTTSLLGSSIYTFAMGLYVLRLTGSALSFAATLILGMLPVVFVNPFAGVLADRLSRKSIAVLMDMANGVLLGLLLLCSSDGGPGLAAIYFSTFMLNVLTVFYDVGIEAGIPDMVNPERLMDINSANKVIEAVSSIAGPVLGGMVFVFADIRLFITLNAASFLISGLTGLLLDFRVNSCDCPVNPEKPVINLFSDIRDALSYMKGEKHIVEVFKYLLFLNLFVGFSLLVPLPYILNNVLRIDPGTLGIIQGSIPVGAIAGAILVKKGRRRMDVLKDLTIMSCIFAACIILTGISTIITGVFHSAIILLLYFCPVMAVMGMTISFIDIPLISMLQLELPENLRGRVLSLGMSFVKAASPLALLASGWSLKTLPPYVTVFSGGIGLLVLAGINFRQYMEQYGRKLLIDDEVVYKE